MPAARAANCVDAFERGRTAQLSPCSSSQPCGVETSLRRALRRKVQAILDMQYSAAGSCDTNLFFEAYGSLSRSRERQSLLRRAVVLFRHRVSQSNGLTGSARRADEGAIPRDALCNKHELRTRICTDREWIACTASGAEVRTRPPREQQRHAIISTLLQARKANASFMFHGASPAATGATLGTRAALTG